VNDKKHDYPNIADRFDISSSQDSFSSNEESVKSENQGATSYLSDGTYFNSYYTKQQLESLFAKTSVTTNVPIQALQSQSETRIDLSCSGKIHLLFDPAGVASTLPAPTGCIGGIKSLAKSWFPSESFSKSVSGTSNDNVTNNCVGSGYLSTESSLIQVNPNQHHHVSNDNISPLQKCFVLRNSSSACSYEANIEQTFPTKDDDRLTFDLLLQFVENYRIHL
jgi:hypothetical protein